MDLETPHGTARMHVRPAQGIARALLALGHGAGGSVDARDLKAATAAARETGVTVALVEQPYRVAGRKSAAPAHQLDTAWLAVLRQLPDELKALPLLAGGRSSGARVACRTAAEAGAVGVLCLAFPVHPPGRPEKTRLGELDAVAAPVLVVQGASDPFGMPPAAPRRDVVVVPGNHSLTGDLDAVREGVAAWLGGLLD